jgi:hypothetical protein
VSNSDSDENSEGVFSKLLKGKQQEKPNLDFSVRLDSSVIRKSLASEKITLPKCKKPLKVSSKFLPFFNTLSPKLLKKFQDFLTFPYVTKNPIHMCKSN